MIDLAIVGAGPAGMAAAIPVADAGFSVLVVDEQARAGGQVFRRPPADWGARHGNYRPYPWARDLIERFEDHPAIQTLFRATAFGVLRDPVATAATPDTASPLRLAVHTHEGGRLIPARRLLIATGAHDMPVAFPGWTLPGVMTVGAVQSLLKSQKLLVGKRLVLAGSHPILLVLAEQLLDAGADIAEIAFARGLPRLSEMVAALPAVPGHVSLLADAFRALGKLLRHGVPISPHCIVAGAEGEDSVRAVRLKRVDRNWNPAGDDRLIEADLLALGYGFNPTTDLARQAGCKLSWNAALGGWVVAHAQFRTTAENIFVAGEPTGVAGAERSRAEGHMAGLHVAASLGAPTNEAQRAEAERLLARAGRFSGVVQRMFQPNRQALAGLSCADDVIVCRCELVRNGEIEAILSRNPFVLTANALKLECRSGMGPCQGRYCEGTVAARIAGIRNTPIEASGHFNARLPVRPVPLQSYCDLTSDGINPPYPGRQRD
jgi:NADPH-dependent 2,4-dienoyl-CoA reductase/sulfur reductase-like enzyme